MERQSACIPRVPCTASDLPPPLPAVALRQPVPLPRLQLVLLYPSLSPANRPPLAALQALLVNPRLVSILRTPRALPCGWTAHAGARPPPAGSAAALPAPLRPRQKVALLVLESPARQAFALRVRDRRHLQKSFECIRRPSREHPRPGTA